MATCENFTYGDMSLWDLLYTKCCNREDTAFPYWDGCHWTSYTMDQLKKDIVSGIGDDLEKEIEEKISEAIEELKDQIIEIVDKEIESKFEDLKTQLEKEISEKLDEAVEELEEKLDTKYVTLNTEQTISAKKTFSVSPIVPSKETDATNDGTAIATEAQVYKVAQTAAALDTRLTTAESDIDSLETSVATNTTNIATNTTNITSLKTQVETNTSDIATLKTSVEGKQDTLVSGINIKTVNSNSLLGSGDISTFEVEDFIPVTSVPTDPDTTKVYVVYTEE